MGSFYDDRVAPFLLGLVAPLFDHHRRALLGEAEGRVLELGVGTGASLPYYGPRVTELIGIDPHEPSLALARRVADRLGRDGSRRGPAAPVRLHLADAESLPFGDGSFDTVVAFLVLCTIPDARAAAAEAHRVLRPGGRLLVLEHVAAGAGGRLRRWQDRVDPLWTRAAGGCHLNRDTAAVLAAAGFDTAPLERFREQRFFPPASPRIRGILTRGRA